MHKLDMGLHYTYNSVNITRIGTILSDGSKLEGYKQMPGEFANKASALSCGGKTISSYDELSAFYVSDVVTTTGSLATKMNYLVQLLQADASTLGYTLSEYTGASIPDGKLYSDRRLIAVVLSTQDFHFYMQHSDNTWSHKPGSTPPSKICFDHNEKLTNENIRTHACESFYDGGVIRFFYITKNAIIDYHHGNGITNSPSATPLTFYDLAGNNIISAQTLGLSGDIDESGNIDYLGDVDCYQFVPSATKVYSVTTKMSDYGSVAITLYNAQGSVMYSDTSYSDGTINFLCQLQSGMQYYIAISRPDQAFHEPACYYTFSIS